MTLKKSTIFLDRDGVLNGLVARDGGFFSPRKFSDFQIFEFVPEVIRKLKDHGFLLVVVTNQPDIARGLMEKSELSKMTSEVLRIGVDHVYICPHDSQDLCACRKPLPGLIFQAAEDLNIDLPASWLVGDRQTDIEAGLASGLRCVLITSRELTDSPQIEGEYWTASNLQDACSLILYKK
jgi:D-glycero-D-manno-heptose 1,7-bisphosphate phosphatase